MADVILDLNALFRVGILLGTLAELPIDALFEVAPS